MKVWSGAGVVGDRKLISDLTGKDKEDLGSFPVNSPECMVLDQSHGKTILVTYTRRLANASPQGKRMGGL